MKINIVADSSANMLASESLSIVPLKIRTEIGEFVDDSKLDCHKLLEAIEAGGRTSTSCPNIAEYATYLEGKENTVVVTISSKLSGSYNAARIAAEDFPNSNILIVDSLSAGPELTLLVEKVQELADKVETWEELVDEVREYQKHANIVYCLESIQNLANNGRVPPIIAKAIGFLGIRMIGTASSEGELELLNKAKGAKKAITVLYNEMKKLGYCGGKVVVNHVFNEDGAEKFKAKILEEYPDANVVISPCTGLCTFYAENHGLMVGFED